MEKTVFCKIGERCKPIRFKTGENESDCDAIRRSLIAACSKDKILKVMLLHKYIVLQRKHLRRTDLICDIEDDEEITDDEVIQVVLIDAKQFESTAINEKSLPLSLCEEPLEEKSTSVDLEGQLTQHSMFKVKTECENEEDLYFTETTVYEALPKANTSNVMDYFFDDTRHGNEPLQNNFDTTEGLSNFSQTSTSDVTSATPLPYPAPLPKFNKKLQALYNQGRLLCNRKDFIRFWAIYLENITDSRPTKKDFKNYSRTIVDNFPELGGGNLGFGLVSQQLSMCLRNRRANTKRKLRLPTNKGKAIDKPIPEAENSLIEKDTLASLEEQLPEQSTVKIKTECENEGNLYLATMDSEALPKPSTSILMGGDGIENTCNENELPEKTFDINEDHSNFPQPSKNEMTRAATLRYPASLPKFNKKLQLLYRQGRLLYNKKDFIRFWAIYLENVTNNRPTKIDFKNYSRSIVDNFPELEGGNGGYSLVSQQLSMCIRNRRANTRRKLGLLGNNQKATDKARYVVPETNGPLTYKDISAAEDGLQKCINLTDSSMRNDIT